MKINTFAFLPRPRMAFAIKHQHQRMPAVTSHLHTPCIHANENGIDSGLAALAGYSPQKGEP